LKLRRRTRTRFLALRRTRERLDAALRRKAKDVRARWRARLKSIERWNACDPGPDPYIRMLKMRLKERRRLREDPERWEKRATADLFACLWRAEGDFRASWREAVAEGAA
jgi:hypothetical protein